MQMIAQQDAIALPTLPQVKKKFKLEDIVNSPNLAEKLNEDERSAIGKWVVGGYVKDVSSRTEWAERHAEGIKIALQVREAKNFPWVNASNVKFPLVTVGALQFLARISILTKGNHIAHFRHVGADPKGEKSLRMKRLTQHINMQLTDEDVGWMDADETTKFAAALVGSAFKKSYYDSVQGMNVSEFIPAQDFVVDYHCKHIDTAGRATHRISMSQNKIAERIAQGLFLEEKNEQKPGTYSPVANILEQVSNQVQGLTANVDPEEFQVLEQHCWFDFDGDGYAEPYVISARLDTGHVYRIVARFFEQGVHRKYDTEMRKLENAALQTQDMQQKSNFEKRADRILHDPTNSIVRIDPEKFFTKYTFVPSPDGGFYGLGLSALLGPVNQAVDTMINQLIDAGTMSNTAGGFLSRGVKMRAGKNSFDPFEWKVVDSTGDDLRKGIFPLPVREPSQVLFNLLGVLIQYGERISSATDIMTGVSPGQNTPATTAQTTVEQGMMLFSGIYARMYRSFREELTKLVNLNRLYLPTSPNYFDLTEGPDAILQPDDYANVGRIFPTADPSAVSGQQRKDRVNQLVQAALSPIGAMWDKAVVSKKWLEANDWDVDEIFPDPQGPRAVKPPVDPKIQSAQAELQFKQQEHQDNMMLEVGKLQAQIVLNKAKVLDLEAKARANHAKADGEPINQDIALLNAQIGALRHHNETLMKSAELLLKGHQARSSIEKEQHGMLMDVQDRLMGREQSQAAAQESVKPEGEANE